MKFANCADPMGETSNRASLPIDRSGHGFPQRRDTARCPEKAQLRCNAVRDALRQCTLAQLARFSLPCVPYQKVGGAALAQHLQYSPGQDMLHRQTVHPARQWAGPSCLDMTDQPLAYWLHRPANAGGFVAGVDLLFPP